MKTLLPSGCYDVLPPFARQQSQLSAAILDFFASYGYEQLAPSLLEYSDNLLAGRGSQLSGQMFRVMDPTAHRVMAIRPDITLQIARIAENQLKDAPRPLRLCYNGLILRLQGDQLKNDRQLRQAGIELIGVSDTAGDAEVIMIAARTLAKFGVRKFTIDLNLPSIVATMVAGDTLTAEQAEQLQTALAHKDAAALAPLPLAYKKTLIALMQHAGEASETLEILQKLDFPVAARTLCNNLREVVLRFQAQQEPGCTLTIDATESQGFNYYSGVGFSIFVPGVAHEVGRGGRYYAGNEEATGFSLYIETLSSLLPPSPIREKILIAPNTSRIECEELQAKGYDVLYAQGNGELTQQATALGCTQIFANGGLTALP